VSLTAHWFLPTYGDGRQLVGGGHGVGVRSAGGVRPASIGYLTQVARAAEARTYVRDGQRRGQGCG
jgi:alkanesulfonate monooxygenase